MQRDQTSETFTLQRLERLRTLGISCLLETFLSGRMHFSSGAILMSLALFLTVQDTINPARGTSFPFRNLEEYWTSTFSSNYSARLKCCCPKAMWNMVHTISHSLFVLLLGRNCTLFSEKASIQAEGHKGWDLAGCGKIRTHNLKSKIVALLTVRQSLNSLRKLSTKKWNGFFSFIMHCLGKLYAFYST